jgi:hypothetical protein
MRLLTNFNTRGNYAATTQGDHAITAPIPDQQQSTTALIKAEGH